MNSGRRTSTVTAYQLKYGVDPKGEYVMSFENLNGGLNIHDLEYQLKPNESPDMMNLNWNDGILSSRAGQVYIDDEDWRESQFDGDYGTAYTCYEQLRWDMIFAHIGAKLYCMSPSDGKWVELCSGVPEVRGTFFAYRDDLVLYKTTGAYIQIERYPDDDEWAYRAGPVPAYVPVTAINCDPATGAGDYYQPVNRMTTAQIRTYEAQNSATAYLIPELPYRADFDPIIEIRVNGTVLPSTGYAGAYVTGGYQITFSTAPADGDTVDIEFDYPHDTNFDSIDSCRFAAVYGGDTNVCVVLGGCALQPNAYFWSGNDSLVMNPGYFPDIYYNFAGDSNEPITGFGKQQNLLIVFKPDSIGKATYGLTDLDGRASITMDYVAINSKIGCDMPWTIQVVENNLVFANSKLGVYILLDSSSARENNVRNISEKINGNERRRGLLALLRETELDKVCSIDTDRKYLIAADGVVYEWDYKVSGYNDPTWFRHNNIHAVAFWRGAPRSWAETPSDVSDALGHVDVHGRVTKFTRNYSDYDEGIEKYYQFPTMPFGSYDRLKNVNSVVFSVRSDTDCDTEILWSCDYCDRKDFTNLFRRGWKLVPRDLTFRSLAVWRYALTFRRKPAFKHVRHFTMRLANAGRGFDLSIVSAQVFYNFQGRER